ncbi:MAG: YlxR family protein [Anaeromyxobacter sp.]|nr:YlxR family protein [Anaeromyxobacter sp.]MBL0277298.1 YlxR family protein [Anaeromyxobacter sp.]
MSEPVRTCLGCGARGARQGLVRLKVSHGGTVVVDERKSGGRGGWLHPAEACLERALKRRAFARAFRRSDLGCDADALRRGLTAVCGRD